MLQWLTRCYNGSHWQTVVPLVNSSRWVHNVGPTLDQHYMYYIKIGKWYLLDLEKEYCVYFVGFQHWDNVRSKLIFANKKVGFFFQFRWLNYFGQMMDQHQNLLIKRGFDGYQHCAFINILRQCVYVCPDSITIFWQMFVNCG